MRLSKALSASDGHISAVDFAKKDDIMIFETYSEEETLSLGRDIGKKACPGTVIAMDGDLGTGKTVLAKGISEGLGVTDMVNSPTFTIVQEYDSGRLPVYHFDVYRILDEDELLEIGADEYFYGQGVCLVEWAEQIRGSLPEHYTRVRIEKDLSRGVDYRRITVEEV